MLTLAFYDVTGIQKFVFGSAKATEIVGASAIVDSALQQWLVDAIKTECPGALTDWRSASSFQSLGPTPPPAEIIYIGGGNALVVFSGTDDDPEGRNRAVAVTQHFSHKVFEETQGTLQVAVAYVAHKESNNYTADRRELEEELAGKKQKLIPARPLMGIGITAEGSTDGLPAEHTDKEGLFLSGPAYKKRSSGKGVRDYENLIPGELCGKCAFPIEFDDLWQKRGENHIAVVHIDGNSMGKTIEKATAGASEVYGDNVQRMRRLSVEIQEIYESAFKEIIKKIPIKKIPEELKNEEFCNLFDVHQDKDTDKTFLPVRPLIFSGDDVTVVCNGRLGIWFATEMLKNISKSRITDVMPDGSAIPMSACAGVAIVKSHFPFARAYGLAEELCSSAKKVAKAMKTPFENGAVGSWLDFHIVYSGITQELSDLRSTSYNVPGMSNAARIYGSCAAYNLLGRPWEIAPPHGQAVDADHDWTAFVAKYDQLKKTWPRSRLKELRDVMICSEQETNEYLQECQSRGYVLPGLWKVGGTQGKAFTNEHRTPYFDALELLDLYVRPPEPEEA